jgi:hypothetical protein
MFVKDIQRDITKLFHTGSIVHISATIEFLITDRNIGRNVNTTYSNFSLYNISVSQTPYQNLSLLLP